MKIEKIIPVEYSGLCYDITVEENHNFFAEDILVHNCKEDGMRINAIVKNGSVTYKSRNGKTVDCNSNQIDSQFVKLASFLGDNVVLDGELLVWDNAKDAPMSRKIGNGICNKAIKGTVSEAEKNLFVICVWDCIPLKDFEAGVCKVPYSKRKERYEVAFELIPWALSRIFPVRSWKIDSWEKAKRIYSDVVSEGKEGLIIKNMKGIWEDKRSKDLVKMKECRDFDGRVVDLVEGNGKYKGMLGSMILQSDDKKICVEVGSGFTDDDRKRLWNRNIIGKVVTINYNEKIQSKDGSWSLFLPVFIEAREDKNTTNNFEDTK